MWTTTPWTLITNAAVAVGPEIEYVRARVPGSDEVYVLAADLVERVLGEEAEVLAHFRGRRSPGSRTSPLLLHLRLRPTRAHRARGRLRHHVRGTGLVHTAIAFGEDDFRLGEQYGIKLQNPVRPDGTFDERITDFEGGS